MRGLVLVRQAPNGVEALCDCGTSTVLVTGDPLYGDLTEGAEDGGVIQVPESGGEAAFTCSGCGSVHWLTFAPLEAAP